MIQCRHVTCHACACAGCAALLDELEALEALRAERDRLQSHCDVLETVAENTPRMCARTRLFVTKEET